MEHLLNENDFHPERISQKNFEAPNGRKDFKFSATSCRKHDRRFGLKRSELYQQLAVLINRLLKEGMEEQFGEMLFTALYAPRTRVWL